MSSATVRVERDGGWLHATLNRPKRRNAMSLEMVDALMDVFATVEQDPTVRAVVLRGEGGHFCSGGDLADMQAAAGEHATHGDPIARLNRRFGTMLQRVDGCRAAVVAVCEGGVMGGGFGLACVADVTLAVQDARFRLPETSLGITPAQIAPFLVRRLGLSQARRLAVTGQTLGADEALRLGLVHEVCAADDVSGRLQAILDRIRRCEPGAVAATKALMNRVAARELDDILDDAALEFATLARKPEAATGMMAMLSRSTPPWAES